MKKDIRPKNDKGQPHGLCEYYWWNGQLYSRCVYINGNKNGFAEFYWGDDGKLSHKTYFL